MADRKVAVDMASGTLAGAAQLMVGHPFDTIKVKLQSGGHFKGSLDATVQTLTKEGIRGFYKGMGAPLVTVAAFNAVLFSSKGMMASLLAHKDSSPLTAFDQALCGAGAGVAVSFVATPTELLKCRLQAQGSIATATARLAAAGIDPRTVTLYRGPMDVARHVVVNEGGALGLLRGISPTLLREIPGNAVMFGVYELLKTLMAKSQGLPDTSGLGTLSLGTAGAVGGAAFWLVMYPADVIKSKIQIDNVHRPIYKGIVDCAIKVHASEGMAGLYRGFAPCIARSFPANAASFLVYELVSGFLNGRSKY